MSKFLVENESGATPDSFYEAILDNYEDFITENRHMYICEV